MFRKSSFILIFCILVQSTTGSSKSKAKYTRLKAAFGGKTMRRADQTFNIHNSCCGKIERKLLTDIKAKLDSLSDKGSVTRTACPQGWVLHGKSCFLIINIPTLKWSDARRTCQNLGGDLAIIRSAEENNFIFDLVKKQKTITDWGVWLGITRKSNKKMYWIDDSPLTGHYSAWGSGEPGSPNSEYCSNMFGAGSRQGKWNDIGCSLKEAQLKYAPSILCQKKSD